MFWGCHWGVEKIVMFSFPSLLFSIECSYFWPNLLPSLRGNSPTSSQSVFAFSAHLPALTSFTRRNLLFTWSLLTPATVWLYWTSDHSSDSLDLMKMVFMFEVPWMSFCFRLLAFLFEFLDFPPSLWGTTVLLSSSCAYNNSPLSVCPYFSTHVADTNSARLLIWSKTQKRLTEIKEILTLTTLFSAVK